MGNHERGGSILDQMRNDKDKNTALGLTLAAMLLAGGAGRVESSTGKSVGNTHPTAGFSQEELVKACKGVVTRIDERDGEVHVYCGDRSVKDEIGVQVVQGGVKNAEIVKPHYHGGRKYDKAGSGVGENAEYQTAVGDVVERATDEHLAWGVGTNEAIRSIDTDVVGHASPEDQIRGGAVNQRLSEKRAAETGEVTGAVFDKYGIDGGKINSSERGGGSEGDVIKLADKLDILPGSKRVRIEKTQDILRLLHDGLIEEALGKIGKKSDVKNAKQLQQAEDEILAVHRVSDVKIKIGTKDVVVHVGKKPEQAQKLIKFLQDHYLPANIAKLQGDKVPHERAPRVLKATGESNYVGRVAVKQKGVSGSPGSFRMGA